MKYIYIPVFLLLLFSCNKHQNHVVLSGDIRNFQGDRVQLVDVSERAGLRMPQNIDILLSPENTFELKIETPQPGYYQLGNNTLYLSPGDKLTMSIDFENQQASWFKGRGKAVNNYLRTIPEPSAVGYLGINNTNVSESIQQFINQYMLPEAEAGFREINNLKGASEAFKELEQARIKSNVIRSLMLYTASYMQKYVDGYNIGRDGDLFRDTRSMQLESATQLLQDYASDIVQARYLVLPEFRRILPFITNPSAEDLPAYQGNTRIDEYRLTESLLQRYAQSFINGNLNPNDVRLELENAPVTTPLYREVIQQSMEEYAGLMPGKPAFDFTAYDINQNAFRLSQFRGKIIYIDFWATWCGPCIMQYPHFMALAHEFSHRDDVVFITVSTDHDKPKWVNYLIENPHDVLSLHADRNELLPYKIAFIPRFVMIDKDFNFIDPFAPRPSLSEAREKLLGLL